MGWWSLEENGKKIGVIGDEGWDLAEDFYEKIVQLYLLKQGRFPTDVEIIETVRFVLTTSAELDEEDEENNGAVAESG